MLLYSHELECMNVFQLRVGVFYWVENIMSFHKPKQKLCDSIDSKMIHVPFVLFINNLFTLVNYITEKKTETEETLYHISDSFVLHFLSVQI